MKKSRRIAEPIIHRPSSAINPWELLEVDDTLTPRYNKKDSEDLSKYLPDENTELEGPSLCFGDPECKFKHIYIDGFDISPFLDIIKAIKTELADRGDFHVNVPKLIDVLFKLGVVFANDTED